MPGSGNAELLNLPPSQWPESIRLSTDEIPEANRLAWFQDFLGRQVNRQEIDPLPETAFYTHMLMRRIPGLVIYWTSSSPRQNRRTRELLSDGNDNLLIQWISRERQVEHLGREILLGAGAGIAFSCSDTRSVFLTGDYETISLSVPRKALGSRLRDMDGSLARPLPGTSGAQQLLLGYVELLRREESTGTPELRDAVMNHVYDLLAIVLGATREAAEIAKSRGVRAARLSAIKKSIREHLCDGNLSIASLAAWHRVTPRYVQLLFEGEGQSYTEFVRDERLLRAHRMLASARCTGRKVVDIAFSCGFGDISYFNRAFRTRFGATPSDVRAQSGRA